MSVSRCPLLGLATPTLLNLSAAFLKRLRDVFRRESKGEHPGIIISFCCSARSVPWNAKRHGDRHHLPTPHVDLHPDS